MYRVLAYAGTDKHGKAVRKSFSGPDKRKVLSDAAAWVDEHRKVDDADCTFGDAVDDFMILRGSALSPATLRGYTNISHQLEQKYPRFWYSRVYGIGSDDVQSLVLQLSRSDLKPKTVKNYIGFISTVLQSKQIRMPIVNLPQKIRPELNVPDIFTVKRTLAAAKDNTELWICIMLAATGPLRRGERNLRIARQGGEDRGPRMVHQHGDDGQCFENAAGNTEAGADTFHKGSGPRGQGCRTAHQ